MADQEACGVSLAEGDGVRGGARQWEGIILSAPNLGTHALVRWSNKTYGVFEEYVAKRHLKRTWSKNATE